MRSGRSNAGDSISIAGTPSGRMDGSESGSTRGATIANGSDTTGTRLCKASASERSMEAPSRWAILLRRSQPLH